MKLINKHVVDVTKIAYEISKIPINYKLSLDYGNSGENCCFRGDYKTNTKPIDMSGMCGILEFDDELSIIEVEPGIKMEDLVDFLLEKGCIPFVVPEFKHITVGGAINGLGCESSSIRYGFFHESVIEYEFIKTNGKLITVCGGGEHKDLFEAIPGSFGSFGVITAVKLKVKKIPSDILLVTSSLVSLTDFVDSTLILHAAHLDDTFIEGIVLDMDVEDDEYCDKNSKNVLLSSAKFYTDTVGIIDWVMTPYYKSTMVSKWYYNYLTESVNTRDRYEFLISVKDYLFRWDKGAFWLASNRISHTLKNRILYGYDDSLSAQTLYKRAKSKDPRERQMKKIIQDCIIPLEKLPNFIKWVSTVFKILPMWICPISQPLRDSIFAPKNGIYVDVGIYGDLLDKDGNRGNTDYVNINKMLETKVYSLGGMKGLCNYCYYTSQEFWNMFDYEKYRKLKYEYDNGDKCIDIFDKISSR